MNEIMEMEFENKEDMLIALKTTKKHIMIGELTVWSKDGFVSKSIKLSCYDDYAGRPVIVSWNSFIGKEHMLTKELESKLSKEALMNQKAALEKLEKTTKDTKDKLVKELKDKGFTPVFGIWKKPEF